ncbi:MAG: redoxin domain-containing protein [Anaerolineae bacterium]|nr:redoxin domain-containing protein [Anaerolineae bacterium]
MATPEFAKRGAKLFIIGPGSAASARRMAETLKIAPEQVLYDETGDVYDRFMLDRVFLSLIQRSALFVLDRAGVVQHAYVVNFPQKWLGGEAFRELMHTLDGLNRAE